jgi:hypothetical protein
VGLDVGVYYRNDNFSAWQPYFDGLPTVSISELEIGGTGSAARLKAATYGRGVWQTPLWAFATPIRQTPADAASRLTDFKAESRAGWLDLQFHLNLRDAPAALWITTVSGRNVHHEPIPGRGFFQRRIDLRAFGKGTYLLRIPGTTIARRFVVL